MDININLKFDPNTKDIIYSNIKINDGISEILKNNNEYLLEYIKNILTNKYNKRYLKDIYKDYIIFCNINKLIPVGKKKLSIVLNNQYKKDRDIKGIFFTLNK